VRFANYNYKANTRLVITKLTRIKIVATRDIRSVKRLQLLTTTTTLRRAIANVFARRAKTTFEIAKG